MDNKTIILLLIPILLIQIVLIIINLINLSKKNETKYLNKTAWIVVLLAFGYIGNIVYLLIEGDKDDSD